MAAKGRRVLLAAHQRLAVGGIGAGAAGLADHVPEAAGAAGIHVEVPAPQGRALAALGARGAAARLRYEQTGLARLARDVDLVHLCDLRPILLSSTPFVSTVHDLDFLDLRGSVSTPARVYKCAMLRAAMRKGPAAVVCHSEFVRRRLLDRFPAIDRRTQVVRPGVVLAEPSWTGGGDPPYFLTVSTIVPRKNHLVLLAAFRRARANGLTAEWVVAGAPGPGSAEIVDAMRAEPGVRLAGKVDSATLNTLYSEALFLATPSASEGFGYAPLEAMAAGTPVLASNGGALPEVVGDAGLVVPADDVDAWVDALVQLAHDATLRERLSASGRERASAFTWGRAAADVVDLYRTLLNGDLAP